MNDGIYVTGHKGRLGSALIEAGCQPFDVDITDAEKLKKAVDERQPKIIINCAAKTDVDLAETQYDAVQKVNYGGVRNLLSALSKETWLVQISTDYVFECRNGPYDETEDVDPSLAVNQYGFTKASAEVAIETVSDNYTIVRTTGLFGGPSKRSDVIRLILKHFQDRPNDKLYMTEELYGNMTDIYSLADSLISMTYKPDRWKNKVIHLAGGYYSRYDFALVVDDLYRLGKKKLITKCRNKELAWKAARPTYGGLLTKLARDEALIRDSSTRIGLIEYGYQLQKEGVSGINL